MLNHAADTPDPEQQVIATDMAARLDAALQELPERQRLALRLFKLEKRSYKEIGERLSVSDRTVERYVADAVRHCRSALGRFQSAD